MKINNIKFDDIVKELKINPSMNIYQLTYNLGCSSGVIYRRLIPKGYNGLIDLKIDIIGNKI